MKEVNSGKQASQKRIPGHGLMGKSLKSHVGYWWHPKMSLCVPTAAGGIFLFLTSERPAILNKIQESIYNKFHPASGCPRITSKLFPINAINLWQWPCILPWLWPSAFFLQNLHQLGELRKIKKLLGIYDSKQLGTGHLCYCLPIGENWFSHVWTQHTGQLTQMQPASVEYHCLVMMIALYL